MAYDLAGFHHHSICPVNRWSSTSTPQVLKYTSKFDLNGTQGYEYNNAITVTATCTVVVFTRTADTQYLWCIGNAGDGSYFISADYGTGYYHGNCGTPTNYVDCVSAGFQPHDNVWHMLEASVNLIYWTAFDWFLYWLDFPVNFFLILD